MKIAKINEQHILEIVDGTNYLLLDSKFGKYENYKS